MSSVAVFLSVALIPLLSSATNADTQRAKRYRLSLHAFERYRAEGGDDIAPPRQEGVRREIKRARLLSLLDALGW